MGIEQITGRPGADSKCGAVLEVGDPSHVTPGGGLGMAGGPPSHPKSVKLFGRRVYLVTLDLILLGSHEYDSVSF